MLVVNRGAIAEKYLKSWIKAAGFNFVEAFADLTQHLKGRASLLSMAKMPQASREIRKSIALGKYSVSQLPPSVIEYIRKNHLYESD